MARSLRYIFQEFWSLNSYLSWRMYWLYFYFNFFNIFNSFKSNFNKDFNSEDNEIGKMLWQGQAGFYDFHTILKSKNEAFGFHRYRFRDSVNFFFLIFLRCALFTFWGDKAKDNLEWKHDQKSQKRANKGPKKNLLKIKFFQLQ